jgi:hypothetical protein
MQITRALAPPPVPVAPFDRSLRTGQRARVPARLRRTGPLTEAADAEAAGGAVDREGARDPGGAWREAV